MYEARQNKEKVSRRIDGGGMARQIMLIRNNRMNPLQLMSIKDQNMTYYSEVDNLGRAKTVTAEIKKNALGKLDGKKPSVYPVGWQYLKDTYGSLRGKWVRFHILNQKLGGPGCDCGNLVPTTHAMNHDELWRDFEEYCKLDNQYENLYFEAKIPAYHTVPSEEKDQGFPKEIDVNLYTDNGTLIYCYNYHMNPPMGSVDRETDSRKIYPNPNISTVQFPNERNSINKDFSRKKEIPFSKEEDNILIKLVQTYGVNRISTYVRNYLPNRTVADCFKRWNRGLNPNISKAHWTPFEDYKLIKLVNQYGTKNWNKVSFFMSNRSDIQCRYRYEQLKAQASQRQNLVSTILPLQQPVPIYNMPMTLPLQQPVPIYNMPIIQHAHDIAFTTTSANIQHAHNIAFTTTSANIQHTHDIAFTTINTEV